MPLDPTDDDLQAFRAADDGNPFVLVQLIRLAPGGREKYLEYAAVAQSILARFGAKVLYAGECVQPLHTAAGEAWDGVICVRYPSRSAYVEMQADPAFQAIAPLRQQALREAMLLPMDDWAGR